MYEDFGGKLIIDTKDQYPTLEGYLQSVTDIDFEKYNLKSITINIVLGEESDPHCVVEDKETGQSKEIRFKAHGTVISDLIKTGEITIVNMPL